MRNGIQIIYTTEREGIMSGDSVRCNRFRYDGRFQTLILWDASGVEDTYHHVVSIIVRTC